MVLPAELVAEIFYFVGEEATTGDWANVSRVCQLWRAAADDALGCWFRRQAMGSSFAHCEMEAAGLGFLRSRLKGKCISS
jgi:hypothetical protein